MHDKTGFFDGPEGKSMNRLLAFIGSMIGGIVALGGIYGWLFKSLADAPIVIGLGLTIYGGSELLKNQGRKLENGGAK